MHLRTAAIPPIRICCTLALQASRQSGFAALEYCKRPRSRDLHDIHLLEGIQEHLHSLRRIAHLDRHIGAGHIHDLSPHDLGILQNILAVRARIAHLQKDHLAADALILAEGLDLDDIDLFVQLLFDLFKRPLVAGADNDHTGDRRIRCRSDCQGVDVKTSSPEQSGHFAQNTRAVFNEDRINSLHTQVYLFLVKDGNVLLCFCILPDKGQKRPALLLHSS